MIEDTTSSMDKVIAPSLRSWRTALLIASAAALVVVAALAFPAVRRWSRADRSVDSTTLRFGTATRGDLMRDISVQARVVAALHPTLYSPAQGIVAVRTKAGSPIRRGDVLATIASEELRSTLSQSQSLLASMRSELERQKILSRQAALRSQQQVELLALRLQAAKRNLVRYETTFREGLSNKADYESAQDAVRIAEMELEQAKKELELDRETLTFDVQNRAQTVVRQQAATDELQRKVEELTVRAPFDGMVASVAVQDGNAIGPNQPVLTVVNLDALELELALPEEYAGDTAIGTVATINFAGREYTGHVTAISPEVINSQVGATVAFQGATPEGLKQNQRVTTRLVFEAKKHVVKVPRGAFLEAGGGRSAYVVDGSMATKRRITVGAMSVGEVEIASGLQVGETIVVSDTSVFEGAQRVLLR